MLGWELPPHNSGGLGIACFELAKSLANNGVDIEFVLPYDAKTEYTFMRVHSAIPQDITSVGVAGIAYDSYKYTYADGRVEWHDIGGQQHLYEQAVGKLVDKLEFDVIHAHDWLTFRAALRAKAISGKPLILHVHSLESDRAGGKHGNPMVHEIEYMSLMLADRVVAISEHTKRCIVRDYAIPEEKIDVVHNSINSDIFESVSEENAYLYLKQMQAKGYRVVVNAGRLTVQKGLPNMLRAAKEVVERFPKALFLIVGTGEQDYELMELAAELGILPNVIFTGFQRGKNLRDSFCIGDLFIMPSISEPFGLTPLEAAACKTASLISKQSGVAEVFRNCLKVDFWDIREMANQIVAVLENDNMRDELRTQAYDEYGRMSWEDSAQKLLRTYHQHAGTLQA